MAWKGSRDLGDTNLLYNREPGYSKLHVLPSVVLALRSDSEALVLTSKNLFNHQTWKMPSPTNTNIWKMLHHFTLEFVLSAVFLCVLSRMTIYDCSSLTCATSSERVRTVISLGCCPNVRTIAHSYLLCPVGLEELRIPGRRLFHER